MKIILLLLVLCSPVLGESKYWRDRFKQHEQTMKDRSRTDRYGPNSEDPDGLAMVRKEFRVSKVGDPKASETQATLLRLCELLQNPPSIGIEKKVTIKGGGHETFVQKEGRINTRSERGGDPFYLYFVEGMKNGGLLAALLKKKELTVGTSVSVILQWNGTWEGDDARTGFPVFYPQYIEVDPQKKPPVIQSLEEFVKRLKAGEAFSVKERVRRGCEKCGGLGKAPISKTSPSTSLCNQCRGTGNAVVTWLIKW